MEQQEVTQDTLASLPLQFLRHPDIQSDAGTPRQSDDLGHAIFSSVTPLWYTQGMVISAQSSHPKPILGSVAECLTPEVARRILSIEFDTTAQARVRELAEKANEGLLELAERSEYEALIEDADLLGIFKSLARQALSR